MIANTAIENQFAIARNQSHVTLGLGHHPCSGVTGPFSFADGCEKPTLLKGTNLYQVNVHIHLVLSNTWEHSLLEATLKCAYWNPLP